MAIHPRTIRFKVIYPTYNDWITKLTPFLDDSNILKETDFNNLLAKYSSRYFKWNISERINQETATNIEDNYYLYQELTNLKAKSLKEISSLNNEAQTDFLNSGNDDNPTEAKYLTGSEIGKSDNQKLTDLETIKELNDKVNKQKLNFYDSFRKLFLPFYIKNLDHNNNPEENENEI